MPSAPTAQRDGLASAYGPIEACQSCSSRALRRVLFLGYLPPVNRLRPLDDPLDAEVWYPADLRYCPICHLVQLGYAVDPHVLFPPEYPYTSGSTRILCENFAELYREVASLVDLSPGDLVVDIGSNDGTLLSNFRDGGHRVLGIEPTLTAALAEERGIPTLMGFLAPETVEAAKSRAGKPKVVTATNVLAHIPAVHEALAQIEELVGDDGVFVSESHYLRDLIETLQYDTIYHEHLRYYSLTSLATLLETHGFHVFHAKRIRTHGGSIRVYASKSSAYALQRSVGDLLAEEELAGFVGDAWIDDFRERVVRSKLDLYGLLTRVHGRIYGVGAPSRGTTLVHYVGLDDGALDCVVEIAGSKKIGQYLPGTIVPVLDEEKLFADQPPFAMLLSWHIADELAEKLRSRGYRGRFIVPLPEPRLL